MNEISNGEEWYYSKRNAGAVDIFATTHTFIDNINPDSVIVEIGSDRGGGSTEYFADIAQKYNTVLHTVDINSDASTRIKHSAIQWHVAVGSEWCKSYSSIAKNISVLYLDNFDYKWNITDEQSNNDCQIEHFKQIYHLYPWLTDDCVVICDDTYQYNGCWVGKCGAVVIFLQSMGFEILHKLNDPLPNSDYRNTPTGVILKRKMK